jgi:hypothetical protein
MKDKDGNKLYTIEEAKEHGKKFIREQAEILRKNLQEKRKDYETADV